MKPIPRFVAPMTFGDAFSALSQKGAIDFEKRFAQYLGLRHVIIAPSGRYAFAAMLEALDFPKGGQVIMPALTFHSMPQMLRERGLEPVFVDVLPGEYCIDPDLAEASVTEKTVAILPTHLYGRACRMDRIMEIAKAHDLRVLEDCAQGCGGSFGGRKLGSIGDAALFSFGPTKNLAMLWAGAVATNSDKIADGARRYLRNLQPMPATTLVKRLIFALAMRAVVQPIIWRLIMVPALKLFSTFGIDPIEKATAETPGENNPADRQARMMPRDAQLRIGLLQLRKLDQSNQRRMKNGNRLIEKLSGTPGIVIPKPAKPGENIFMSFPVLVDDRESFSKKLMEKGVDTAFGYMDICPGMADRQAAEKLAPVSYDAVSKMLHLPVYPELDSKEIDRLVESISMLRKKY